MGNGAAEPSFSSWLGRNWLWLAVASVAAIVLISFTPAALYFWSYAGFKRLLHDDAGLGAAWASVAAVFLALGYALAIPYAGHWFILGRRKRKVEAVVATIFLLAVTPTLHALFDTTFNQETGQAQKWYVWRDGTLVFSDSPGFDPITQAKRKLVTPEIAKMWERQQNRALPHRLTGDLSKTNFFNSITGKPSVWYERTDDGNVAFYDEQGFSPVDGRPLQPVTPEIVAEAMKRTKNMNSDDASTRPTSGAITDDQAKNFAKARIPLASEPISDWPAIGMRPGGPSIRFLVTTLTRPVFRGSGFAVHCVYNDGHTEISPFANSCPIDPQIFAAYLTNTTNEDITAYYAYKVH